MNIEKISDTEKFVIHCDRCDTIIQYSAQDTQKDFKCPVCKQELIPTWENSSDSNVNITYTKIIPDYIHNLNPGDNISLEHSIHGSIAFDVVAKDYLIDGTVTLVSQKCITNMEWDTENENNYSKSSIRHWLNTDFLNGFVKPLRDSIKTAKWECHNKDEVEYLHDKITIPSMTEMGMDGPIFSQLEGICFSYKNINDKFTPVIFGGRAPTYCWSRTPSTLDHCHAHSFDIYRVPWCGKCSEVGGIPACFII